jgi:hypothetical protein
MLTGDSGLPGSAVYMRVQRKTVVRYRDAQLLLNCHFFRVYRRVLPEVHLTISRL